MMFDQMNAVVQSNPLMDTAWTILEAANDLGDRVTVEICRRVIDSSLRGIAPAKTDIDVIFDFFGKL
jgi:hypothetical protein